MKRFAFNMAIVIATGLSPVVHATTYTSYAAFASAAGSLTTESFSTLATGTLIPSGSTVDGITYSFGLSGGATVGYIDDHGNSFSGKSLSRPTSAFQPNDRITLSFSTPVRAVGFYINTLLGYKYQMTDNEATAQTASTTSSTPYDTSTFQFLGIVSPTSFTSVVITGGTDFAGNPAVPWGSPRIVFAPVPEPNSLVLGLAGAGLLAWVSRRNARLDADQHAISA